MQPTQKTARLICSIVRNNKFKTKEILNMKKIVLIFLFCLAMSSLLLAAEKPSEESLIKAWEELQKRDSNTATFEKIADRRYKFRTNLFPFVYAHMPAVIIIQMHFSC
jgi:hypothetical protein